MENKNFISSFDNFSDEYLLKDTLVGSTINLYRRLQGISLYELSILTQIEITVLNYIEQDIISPLDDIKLICQHIKIPFKVLILNAILHEDDFEQIEIQQLAKLFKPIIHKWTKEFYCKNTLRVENMPILAN